MSIVRREGNLLPPYSVLLAYVNFLHIFVLVFCHWTCAYQLPCRSPQRYYKTLSNTVRKFTGVLISWDLRFTSLRACIPIKLITLRSHTAQDYQPFICFSMACRKEPFSVVLLSNSQRSRLQGQHLIKESFLGWIVNIHTVRFTVFHPWPAKRNFKHLVACI